MLINKRRVFAPIVAAGALALALVPGATGMAHIVATPSQGAAGSFFQASFRVGHGCEESPTVAVRIQIPAGVSGVRAQAKPGWETELVTGTLPEPIESEGQTITEGVTEVIWRGGPLSNDNYDDFGLTMRLPNTPGETLHFRTIQDCEEGELAWIEIAAEGEEEPEHPAPAIAITDAAGDGHDSEEEAGDDDDDDNVPTVLSIVALVVGALGLVAGGGAFAASRRKR
jgi:uncharacterized protein YcnI